MSDEAKLGAVYIVGAFLVSMGLGVVFTQSLDNIITGAGVSLTVLGVAMLWRVGV